MNQTNLFLMPDYFPTFSCKMGACRTVCCSGWQVSISLDNYFALLGTECSPELRRKMDCALKPVDYPDEGKYAVIHPNYFGNCPLRLEDGRCGVQAELGEDILPDICRLYPRGVRRHGDHYEISLANSCEAVPELFLHRDAPISFIEKEWSMKLPPMPAEELGSWEERKFCLAKLQDRTLSLPCRLAYLGAKEAKNASKATVGQVALMLQELLSHSDSLEGYGETVLSVYEKNDYSDLKEKFAAFLPDHENFFEHLMVNHAFFSRYPLAAHITKEDRFAALTVVYALVRFLAVCYTAQNQNESALCDVVAAAFRLISHTEFDRSALYLLHKYLPETDPAELMTL